MRYKFYREHKYVSFMLTELERLIAKTDFRDNTQLTRVKEQLQQVTFLHQGHIRYEEDRLHTLLTNQGSTMHLVIEEDHRQQENDLAQLQVQLLEIEKHPKQERVALSDSWYLAYRKFVCDVLIHLHVEETVILPELHRLYSDEQLRAVEFNTYAYSSPEQMIHMIEILFPHMNTSDHDAFLLDMKEADPEKFALVLSKLNGI